MSSQQRKKTIKAYLFAIVSNVCLATLHLIIKYFTQFQHPTYWFGIRGILCFLIMLQLTNQKGESLSVRSPEVHRILMVRSVASGLTQIAHTAPLTVLPIGITTTLYNIGPIMVVFLEYFFFKKGSIKKMHLLLTLISFIGVVFIVQPEQIFGATQVEKPQFYYYLIAFSSAIFASLSMLYLHELYGKCDPVVPLSYGYLFQGELNFIAFGIIFSHENRQLNQWPHWSIIVIGMVLMLILGHATQLTRVKSVFLSSPSKVMPFGYAGVVLSMCFDVLIFGIQFNTLVIVGIFLTSIGLLTKFFVSDQ